MFLIAGYDTTSISLAYATYLLAINPDKQKQLLDEIDHAHLDLEVVVEESSVLLGLPRT